MTGKEAFFNADNGVVTSTEPVRLQLVFDVLMGIFYRVVLQTNVHNNVRMMCWPFREGWGMVRQSLHLEDDGRREEF